MKYVLIDEEVSEGVQRIHHLVFPEFMTHSVVAFGYIAAFRHEEKRTLTVRSAGFCHIRAGELYVTEHGSMSLGVKTSIGQAADDDFYLKRPEAFNGLVY